MEVTVSANICFGLFYFFMLTTISTGYVTYFPLSDVHLTFPHNDEAIDILQQNPPFVQVNARLMQDDSSDSSKNRFHYGIDDTQNYLSINELNGEITIEDKIKKLDKNITFTISANVINYTTNGSSNVARMSLKIVPVNISLSDLCKDFGRICFWDSAMYAVPENVLYGNTLIGSLGPIFYGKLCPNYYVKYSLINSTTNFSIKSNMLHANTRFDHDSFSPGPTINAFIKCEVLNRFHYQMAVENKLLRINILDRNDNPPEVQNEQDIFIKIDDPHFRKGTKISENIIFTDKDSIAVNSNIIYEIQNDVLDILEPLCYAYDSDHLGLKSTAINCKLVFSRNGILGISPYCISLMAIDKSVVLIQNFAYKSSSTRICLITDIDKIHEHDKPAAQPLQSKIERNNRKNYKKERKYINTSEDTSISDESGQISSERNVVVNYPQQVTINRRFTHMARVTQPNNSTFLEPLFKFKIINDPAKAFGITEREGIIYVMNEFAIQNISDKILYVTVAWKKGFSANIEISVEDVQWKGANNCKTSEPLIGCSEIDNKKKCLETCGVASEGRGCEWQSSNLTTLTPKYTTCSPSLSYCPNGVCDALEELAEQVGYLVCPQDCTTNIMGPHTTNGTGIKAATGLCTCDTFGKCTCASHEIFPGKTSTNKKSESLTVSNTKVQHIGNNYNDKTYPQCGIPCIILVILCPVSLTIVIICLVLSRRKYIQKNRKQLEINSSLNERRETETETLTDVPLVSIHTEFTFKNEGDPKWEFPRTQLILDVTLGEGEFGKVVKGYATEIGGKPGVTTVAVKMLKNGANSVELLALLSEYQLLQEVHHPNVIQLLGACTQDSPLIIIEYAMYGSLRNYLRFSRKLECSGIEPTDGVGPVAAKDILSFAWQICKGMAYLTEIKLVHRDLAARNVLLAEGKVCKISDFGLTRDVYEDDAYLKRSKDRVPVKWMAPESLADHVYTTRSDVWAFGILAWELITLGASPYPGIPPQNLYHLLKTGYRMERPENCSDEIYAIIKSCWADDANSRPSFKLLASQWEKLLGNSVKYLELDSNGISNPLYCSNSFSKEECSDDKSEALSEIPQEELLDHLWRPPSSFDTTTSTVPSVIPMGYDVPRSLIETKTTEQQLRYQNDLTVPLKNNGLYKLPRISQQNIFVDLSHYDSPVKRRKSYVDMSGGTIYNLESQNADKKKLSKDITFRFSSLLNLNEQMTSLM